MEFQNEFLHELIFAASRLAFRAAKGYLLASVAPLLTAAVATYPSLGLMVQATGLTVGALLGARPHDEGPFRRTRAMGTSWVYLGIGAALIAARLNPVLRQSIWLSRAATGVAILPFASHVACAAVLKLWTPIGAAVRTKIISLTLTRGRVESSVLRGVFSNIPVLKSAEISQHTHGESAAIRNSGSNTAALVSANLGLEPIFVQKSLSDVRKGRRGPRSYHWPKDLAVAPEDFTFNPEKEALVLVDVDYYIDMPLMLARYPGTYFIVTFQPAMAAKARGEYSFLFRRDHHVVYRVSGGAEYVHMVWDYAGDTLLVFSPGLFITTVTAYHIDRKELDPHHPLIMLTVIGTYTLPSLVPPRLILDGRALVRYRPFHEGYISFDVIRRDGVYRTIAKEFQHAAVTMDKRLVDAVLATADVSTIKINAGTVSSLVSTRDPANNMVVDGLSPGHAAILTGYVRTLINHKPPVVYPAQDGLIQIYFGKYDYDCRPAMEPFGSPLIEPCYTFKKSMATEDRCIKGRIEKFKTLDHRSISATTLGYILEFAAFLIPERHVGHPAPLETVSERQPRPSQQHILQSAYNMGDFIKRVIKSFVKAEPAHKVTDPRNISTLPDKTKMEYSAYMYAFHDGVMCQQDWYAFAKTPRECAERIAEMLADIGHACPADGNRFDGHVDFPFRVLERVVMLMYFHPQHHEDLIRAMNEQVSQPGVTPEGRIYETLLTRLSGSGETGEFNSLGTAFIDYLANRLTVRDGKRTSPAQSWAKLGIYGGDDSLARDVDPICLKKAAKIMGQDYDVTVVKRGDIGIEFLNRQFGPDIWTGSLESVANPKRLLSKLFVGPPGLQVPIKRLGERLSGYYRTDKNSMVIGPLVQLAEVLLGTYEQGQLVSWDGRHPREVNWPNDEADWMQAHFLAAIPDFDFEVFTAWLDKIRATKDVSLFFKAPMCVNTGYVKPETVKTETNVGDDFCYPEEPEAPDAGAQEQPVHPEPTPAEERNDNPPPEFHYECSVPPFATFGDPFSSTESDAVFSPTSAGSEPLSQATKRQTGVAAETIIDTIPKQEAVKNKPPSRKPYDWCVSCGKEPVPETAVSNNCRFHWLSHKPVAKADGKMPTPSEHTRANMKVPSTEAVDMRDPNNWPRPKNPADVPAWEQKKKSVLERRTLKAQRQGSSSRK